MKLIGHRGSSHTAPENTLASVRLAWEERADGVEIDVHLTRDNRIVVIHDDNTFRTTQRIAAIRDLTLDQIKQLDAGTWKDDRWAGEPVPELSEVLTTVPAGKLLFVEIKCGAEVLSELRKLVERHPLVARSLVFVGFSLNTMRLTKRQFPKCDVFWNVEVATDVELGGTKPPADELARKAREAGIDGLGVSFCDGISAAFANVVRGAGLKLFVWTVDEPEGAVRMRTAGAHYLATNRPGWLREQITRE